MLDYDSWIEDYNKYRRFFTVLSSDDHEMYILTLEDLNDMRAEHKEYYYDIFKNGL